VYTHENCGQGTVISGSHFSSLANPFSQVGKTLCASCKEFVDLKTVHWHDTGENVAAYRRRLLRAAPLTLRMFGWLISSLAGAALGAGIGWFCTPKDPKGPIIGGGTGFLLGFVFLTPYLPRLIWQIDYRGKL